MKYGRRALVLVRVVLPLVLAVGLLVGHPVDLAAQASAQIQAALRVFLTTANIWTGTQTFNDIVVNGTCVGAGCAGGGGGAPTNATYITQTANAGLSAEQALSTLSTGIMRVATTTGVITSLTDSAGIAANISDETGTGGLVFATSPTLTTPNLGTPSTLVLTNATGLPIASGITGLGAGVATFLATPSSANLISAVTDETGTGALVFANTPTLVTPVLGAATGTSVTLTGVMSSAALINGYVTKTGTYTASATDSTIEGLTNAFTINLPTAAGITGRIYTIKNLQTANAVTVDPAGSETIDGAATVAVANGALTIQSDGTNWRSLGSLGVGLGAIAQGDLLYGSAANVLSTLTKDTNATRYLSNTGSSNNPAWAQVALATGVSGTLPVANGGTGLTAGTSGGVLAYTASGTITSSAALASNAVVLGGGAGQTPKTVVGFTTDGASIMTLGVSTSSKGALVLSGNTSGAVTIQPAAAAGTWSLTLPTTGGTNGYSLTTDGSGVTTWSNIGGGGVGCVPVGSATQVITDSGAGACTSNAAFVYAAGVATLGTAGSVVGKVALLNATSGSITLSPVTGALGTVTLSLPAATDTLVGKATTDTLTNKTLTTPTIADFTNATHTHTNAAGGGTLVTGALVGAGQANTWTTGAQSFASATSLLIPASAGYAPTANGSIGYDTTQNAYSVGGNGGVTGSLLQSVTMSYSSTDTLDAATISTTETSFAQKCTVKSGMLIAGKTMHVTVYPLFTTSGSPPTSAFKARWGGTASSSSPGGSIIYSSGATAALTINLTAIAGGPFDFLVVGTAAAGASVGIFAPPASVPWLQVQRNTTAQPVTGLATNADKDIVFTWTFGANTAGNTVTLGAVSCVWMN